MHFRRLVPSSYLLSRKRKEEKRRLHFLLLLRFFYDQRLRRLGFFVFFVFLGWFLGSLEVIEVGDVLDFWL